MQRFKELALQQEQAAPSRRSFLKMMAATTGAAFVIGYGEYGEAQAHDHVEEKSFTPFIRIGRDSSVTVLIKHLDKGQGIATGLATLVAEEIDASPSQIDVEFAPAHPDYNNLFFGIQATGGSTAIANSFKQYRSAGAAARAVLVKAAARQWGVGQADITVDAGVIKYGDKELTFGEAIQHSKEGDLPAEPALKPQADWKYIGKHFSRVDAAPKSHGSVNLFAMDFQPDGYLVASLIVPPRFGAVVKGFDASKASKIDGVEKVVEVDNTIAVIATKTWIAFKAKRLIDVEWDFTNAENRGSETLFNEFKLAAAKEGLKAETRKDVDAALKQAHSVEEFEYEFPYLAHATMEPLAATVQFKDNVVDVWTGSQMPTLDQAAAAAVFGVAQDKVNINSQWAGGSFGRRAVANSDFVTLAAKVAKAWGGDEAVKLVWSREDDMMSGYFRPMAVHKARLGFDAEGQLLGWQHHVVSQSILKGTLFEPMLVKDGIDGATVEGIHNNTYDVGAFSLDITHPEVGVPVLWWRSVGHTHTAYVVETLMDIAASKAGIDPVEFRRQKMKEDPRKLAVMEKVAEMCDWKNGPAAGKYRGIAVHSSFSSYAAEVAEISLDDGVIKVERVWCAIDCGIAVNPDNIKAQMEGGIGFGLGAILKNEITLENGEIEQTNFDGFDPLRIEEMPEIDVVIMPSAEAPTGVGEPGVPPIGPAVANAVFAARNAMPTRLPIQLS